MPSGSRVRGDGVQDPMVDPEAVRVRRRQIVRVSAVTVVVTVAVLGLLIWLVPGPTVRDVPIAGRDDQPTTDLAEVDPAELVDLDTALDATRSEGTARLTYRHERGGRYRQIAVGMLDLAADRALVGLAGTRQLFDGDQVFLRFSDDDRPWAQVALDELGSARGEPVPGSADPRAHLELVARADGATYAGVVEVGVGVLSLDSVELARVTAVADVSATLDNLRADLEALDAAEEGFDADGLPGQPSIDALVEEVRVHDGRLPIEVWVDADRRIWRVAYDLDDWVGGPGGFDGAAGAGRFALDLRDFGSRVTIEPPEPDEIVGLEDLPDDWLG